MVVSSRGRRSSEASAQLMALTPGTTLGPYDVTAQIGQGGMGEVYRARDTKLNRDVALKVLPDAFASDPDRLARWRYGTRLGVSGSRPLTTREGRGASRTGCRRKMLWHHIRSSFTRGRTSWCFGLSEAPADDYSGSPIGSQLTTRRQVKVSRSRQR